jgi:hypothetical protein
MDKNSNLEKNRVVVTDDDDLPPELEDLSEELNKIRINKGKTANDGESSEIKVNVINNKNIQNFEKNQNLNSKIQNNSIPENKSTTPTISDNNKEEEFGSFMKKGFFKKQSQPKSQPKVEDLTHIKSSTETTTKTKLIEEFKQELNTQKSTPEATASVLNNIVNKKDEWMNQELLTKIAQKPNLLKYFMDPRFTEVMALMQKDPQAAFARYGHVKEFSDFMKEFSSIMADHFNNLSKQKAEEEKMKSTQMNNFDQETQEILNDPKIAPIIFKLQTEGKLDIDEVNKDIYVSSRIKKLIDKGVFRVQTESELNAQK